MAGKKVVIVGEVYDPTLSIGGGPTPPQAPVDPGWGIPAPPLGIWGGAPVPVPTPPIYIPVVPPPDSGLKPEHPIYLPVYPSHPIVIVPRPPEGGEKPLPPYVWPPTIWGGPGSLPPVIGGGPIIPPESGNRPMPPIYIPVFPAHPIVLPPEEGVPPIDAHPEHPIYIPVYPAHPIVLPPDGPPSGGQPPSEGEIASQITWAYTPQYGWHKAYVPGGDDPSPKRRG